MTCKIQFPPVNASKSSELLENCREDYIEFTTVELHEKSSLKSVKHNVAVGQKVEYILKRRGKQASNLLIVTERIVEIKLLIV